MRGNIKTAPSDTVYKEVQEKCIEVWEEKLKTGSHPDYIAGKVNYIKKLKNIEDNMMTMVAMFSADNLVKLSDKLSDEAKQEIYNRLVIGGAVFASQIFRW